MADDQDQGLDAILKKLSPEDAKLFMKLAAATAVDAVEAHPGSLRLYSRNARPYRHRTGRS